MPRVTPIQLRNQDLPGVGSPTTLQNLNTFFSQVAAFINSFGTFTWKTPGLVNGWTNYAGQPVRYSKLITGQVHIEGAVQGGALNEVAFTLPAGYRPGQAITIATNANGAFGYLSILVDGSVSVFAISSTYISVTATFLAEN